MGPVREAVLAYLSRYTHRMDSNSRLLALDEGGVNFRWKDYCAKGKTRYKALTISPEELMRRFRLHVLPSGFHRIRHCGLLANGNRKRGLAAARELIDVPADVPPDTRAMQRRTTSPRRSHHLRVPPLRAADGHRALFAWT